IAIHAGDLDQAAELEARAHHRGSGEQLMAALAQPLHAPEQHAPNELWRRERGRLAQRVRIVLARRRDPLRELAQEQRVAARLLVDEPRELRLHRALEQLVEQLARLGLVELVDLEALAEGE